MKRAIFIGVTLIVSICLWACGRVDEIQHIQGTEDSISKEQPLVDLIEEKLLTPKPPEEEDSYFFTQGATSYVYKASFADFGPQQKEKEVVLHITEVQVFEEGILMN